MNDFLSHAYNNDINNSQLLSKRRDMLQTLKYVLVCQNLSDKFLWKGEENSIFHEFYDNYDHMAEELLE